MQIITLHARWWLVVQTADLTRFLWKAVFRVRMQNGAKQTNPAGGSFIMLMRKVRREHPGM